jgi:Ca-activated chloride channel family protein
LWAIVFVAAWPWFAQGIRPRVAWPSLTGFRRARLSGWVGFRYLSPALRALALACLAVALARPQTVAGTTRIAGRGLAIVVALDHSSSMNTTDFAKPGDREPQSRLAAARSTLERFVAGRRDDLIGLVVFANYPDLVCPPTLQHEFLINSTRAVRQARPGDDGTNLGWAIAWSLDAVRATPAKRKVIILLTDGQNSPAVPHPLDPVEAAALAHELGVVVHTIAIGRAGGMNRQVEPITGLDVVSQVEGPDLVLLEQIARAGGGRAFQATDADSLQRVFDTLNTLERSPIQGILRTRYHEEFTPWAAVSLVALLLERWLAAGRLRRLP